MDSQTVFDSWSIMLHNIASKIINMWWSSDYLMLAILFFSPLYIFHIMSFCHFIYFSLLEFEKLFFHVCCLTHATWIAQMLNLSEFMISTNCWAMVMVFTYLAQFLSGEWSQQHFHPCMISGEWSQQHFHPCMIIFILAGSHLHNGSDFCSRIKF